MSIITFTPAKSNCSHILIIGGGGIFLIGGDVDLVAGTDWEVGIAHSVACANLGSFLLNKSSHNQQMRRFRGQALGTYCIKSDSKRTARLLPFSFLGVIDDRLVVLFDKS